MCEIIAITNQKGGVGKTTSTIQLAIGLNLRDKNVLLVDMDPQCNLSYAVGIESNTNPTILDVMLGKADSGDAIYHLDEIDLISADPLLSSMEQQVEVHGKEYRLKQALDPLRAFYDFIIIDSPPTLGLLTVNVLTAADRVIITAQADIFSLQGIGQLNSTIDAVKDNCNTGLIMDGILLTRYTSRVNHNRDIQEMMAETANALGIHMYESTIRESVVVREAQTMQMSIFKYAKNSNVAKDYDMFIDEFLKNLNK